MMNFPFWILYYITAESTWQMDNLPDNVWSGALSERANETGLKPQWRQKHEHELI